MEPIECMEEKDYHSWTWYKRKLHSKQNYPYYREGEIWFCSLGLNIGWEEDRKHELFERPVLVIKKFRPSLFLAVPFSSKMKTGSHFYHILRNGSMFTAMLLQMRVVDARRLQRKLYMLPSKDFDEIVQRLCDVIKTSAPPCCGASEQIESIEMPL